MSRPDVLSDLISGRWNVDDAIHLTQEKAPPKSEEAHLIGLYVEFREHCRDQKLSDRQTFVRFLEAMNVSPKEHRNLKYKLRRKGFKV